MWQIDALRGVAILMMIIFHTLYDITYLGNYTFTVHSGFWWYFARVTASFFLIIAGISLTLSYNRIKDFMSMRDMEEKYLV